MMADEQLEPRTRRAPGAPVAPSRPPRPSGTSPAPPGALAGLQPRFPRVDSAFVGQTSGFLRQERSPLPVSRMSVPSASNGSAYSYEADAGASEAAGEVRKKRRLASPKAQRYEEALESQEHTASDSGVEDGGTTAGSAKSDENDVPARKKRVRGYRKATHTIRKV